MLRGLAKSKVKTRLSICQVLFGTLLYSGASGEALHPSKPGFLIYSGSKINPHQLHFQIMTWWGCRAPELS